MLFSWLFSDYSFGCHFGSFFNVCAAYIDNHLNTVLLYSQIENLFGSGFAQILARQENGVWQINGEAIANTGWIIILLQIIVSRLFERRKALPSFMLGLFIAACGYFIIGYSINLGPATVILGIAVFAIGEMISSPRIQEYITWIAPKEKAGLYMGSNFLATCIGALLSGITYTKWFGDFEAMNNPEYIWYLLAAHLIVGVLVMYIFTKLWVILTNKRVKLTCNIV
ncbi:MAG: MFS transporter [Bacteroidales bacterium]|nr:MFS transporter [Bacteroidales bacterium]